MACPDEIDALLLGARRGPGEGARLLDAHLVTCATCRFSLALGRAVGPLPDVDAEDDAMAARLIARALAPRIVAVPVVCAARMRARPPHWAMVATALALAAGVASAAAWTGRRLFAPTHEVSRSAARQTSVRPADQTMAPPTPSEAPAPIDSPVAADARDSVVARRAVVSPRASDSARVPTTPVVSTETAAMLLVSANEARRARRFDEAARIYDVLQTRFPNSREAILSHLSRGTLALGRGDFASALAQFDAYLDAGVADLGEEALLGKARALTGLGRAVEEREAWRTLEARYPSSQYRWRAQQRLQELPP
ncbi:MAG TPA: tetratricopeptide repeat protein [Polyangia bacterium]|jgi:TolA-binding protein|nr:tetratricopeptide repeat protein [Polyangia bacterium]